jgi:hypothetical protein
MHPSFPRFRSTGRLWGIQRDENRDIYRTTGYVLLAGDSLEEQTNDHRGALHATEERKRTLIDDLHLAEA